MRQPVPRIGPTRTLSSPVAAPEPSRRRFLFALSAGSAGAAAAVAAPALATPAAIGPASPDEKGAGYRETEHVRDYYATTRL